MVGGLASGVVDRALIGGVMVGGLASGVVDRAFIGGVMVGGLASGVVDRAFIGGVMVGGLASGVVDRAFEPLSGQTIVGNPRMITLRSSLLSRGFSTMRSNQRL